MSDLMSYIGENINQLMEILSLYNYFDYHTSLSKFKLILTNKLIISPISTIWISVIFEKQPSFNTTTTLFL